MNSLSADAYERSELASQQVNAFVVGRNQSPRPRDCPRRSNRRDRRLCGREIVASDHEIAAMLERTMALSPALVEINVAEETGRC